MEGFERCALLDVPPHFENAGHRNLLAVDEGIQSGVPSDLPLPAQPVLETIFNRECRPVS